MTNTAAVERSDSQRSQRSQGNGPRVSFNRDVHVKRIDLNPDRFHSLPSRKKHSPLSATTANKPVNRSSSDVSAKSKPTKKASIFSLFTGRKPTAPDHPSATESAAGELQWRRVGRSRSDVGQPGGTARPTITGIRKRNNSDGNDEQGAASSSSKKKSVPLSPIIENPPRQSYFGDADLGASPAVLAGNIGYTHLAELDQVPSKPPAVAAAPVATDMPMHSSQQPADRLPLTKGVTVDGIVKRLSAERFSPVPNLQSAAFSYTRPNDTKIVYAQVMKDIEANGGLNGGDSVSPPTRYSFQTTKTHSPEVRPVNFRDKYLSDRASPVGQRASLSPPQKLYDEDTVDTAPAHLQPHRGYEERPIIPIIRQVNYQYPEMNALSNRRQLLESRLNSRRLGASAEQLDPVPTHRPVTRTHDIRVDDLYENQPQGLRKSAEPECPPRRRWRAKSAERDRAPYIEDCYDDPAADEVDFVPRAPHVPATKRRPAEPRVIDLGYIEDVANLTDHTDNDHHSFHQNKFREQYRQEFEPQSLDSQFGEMPGHHPHPAPLQQRSVSPMAQHAVGGHQQYRYAEPGQTLLREQRTQRSFDRGDSGIERDYRKNSAGLADDFSNGSRTWKSMHTLYAPDDAAELRQRTEQFLRRERQHCDRQQALRHQYIFRERSIDDGSHYDPRLDKYPAGSTATYRKYPSPTAVDCNANHMGGSSGSSKSTSPPARSERTTLSGLMGLDKVKQLFTGKKKTGATAATSATAISKTTPTSPPTTLRKKEKDRRMRRGVGGVGGYEDDEATRQSQQSQHSYQSSKSAKSLTAGSGSGGGNGLSILREPKLSDIATRRRLSTPKASPQLPKRATAPPSTLSKSSRTSGQTTTTSSLSPEVAVANGKKKEPARKAWYKSLERLTAPIKNHHQAPNYGKKRLSQSTNTLNKDSRSIGLHNDAPTRAQHHQHQLQPAQHHQSHQQLSTSSYAPPHQHQENVSPGRHHSSAKSLRFFGDTDLDSNPATISRGYSAGTMKRTPLANLPARDAGSTQTLPRKYAQAASSGTNGMGMPPTKPTRSGRKEFRSSTKHLHNISESASDVDEPDATAGRHRTFNGHHHHHQPSSTAAVLEQQPPTTVADLRHAMKTRSRSSPVRRTVAASSGTFQRSSSRHISANGTADDHGEPLGYNYRSSSELDQRRSRSPSAGAPELNRKPPTGSQPHLARLSAASAGSQSTLNRRAAAAKHSRDRERALDSSGTEGDSSQHSVVYLHPPTVGAIPQPHVLRSRRDHSREELSSARSSSLTGTTTGTLKSRKSTTSGKSAKMAKAPLQPMSRTVSRSLSLLAPWSPRHLHEGYEIDYSKQSNGQEAPPKPSQAPRHPPAAPVSRSSHSRKYYGQPGDPQLSANGSDSDRRPTSMLRHYREQDMRRETISIPSRR